MKDPVVDHLSMWFQRWLWFLGLSLLQAISLALWVLLAQFDIEIRSLMFWLRSAWTPLGGNMLPRVILDGVLIIGFLNTTVLYLVLGKWWKKRGDVHRRGARFDEREG